MAKQFLYSSKPTLMFGFASFDLLNDFLIDLNSGNKQNLNSLSAFSGTFKRKRFVEYIFFITKELRIDPLAGYHAIELLQRFMVKHLADLLTASTPPGAAANQPKNMEDIAFDTLRDKFPIVAFSCVQLASKMSIHSHAIELGAAVRFLHSVGHRISKRALLESELMVLKGLEFRLVVPNPLTYIETLLEVLGHNEPSVPVGRLHHLCYHVLQFITLERTAVYDSLLMATIQCPGPSREQREKFVTVTEDCMLLGVAVIAVATFILHARNWKNVVRELSHITGISQRSISDFADVTLEHIFKSKA